MPGRSLLVTGGAGFIGSNFCHYWAAAHPDDQIIVLDALTYAGNLENLSALKDKAGFRFVHGDIQDRDAVEPLMEEADIVINFAAETHVDRSIVEAGSFVMTDVFGTFVLLEAARKYPVERFIHISTDEVYGEALNGRPSSELDPLFPKSPYAASKAGADRLAWSYFATYDIPVVITRCSNNYGPYQYPEKLIPLFVTNALEDKSLPVYGSGRNTRDWIQAEDHCRAIDFILGLKRVEGEIFNIGTGDEKSINEISLLILDRLGKPVSLAKPVKDRPGHVLRHAVDSAKLRALGWQPVHDFAAGLADTIDWYVDNEAWWRSIKDGRPDYASFMSQWYSDR